MGITTRKPHRPAPEAGSRALKAAKRLQDAKRAPVSGDPPAIFLIRDRLERPRTGIYSISPEEIFLDSS